MNKKIFKYILKQLSIMYIIMNLRNLFFLSTAIYSFSFSLYYKKVYLQFNFLILKIKKSLLVFDRGYVRVQNKWIRSENVEFLENKYVSYILKLIIKEYSIRNSRANIIRWTC